MNLQVHLQGFELNQQERFIPFECKGIVSVIADAGRQVFLKTPTILQMGMCGAPVVYSDNVTCLGMIEGTYTKSEPAQLMNTAAFISSKELIPFVQHVEQEMVQQTENDNDDDKW